VTVGGRQERPATARPHRGPSTPTTSRGRMPARPTSGRSGPHRPRRCPTDDDHHSDEQFRGVPDQELPPEVPEPDDHAHRRRSTAGPAPDHPWGPPPAGATGRCGARPPGRAPRPVPMPPRRTRRPAPVWPGRTRASARRRPRRTQKVPKLTSISPTAIFMAFSGTDDELPGQDQPDHRDHHHGRAGRQGRPARGCREAVPRVSTMTTTSRPSRNTPLNATTNPVVSRPSGRRPIGQLGHLLGDRWRPRRAWP
jgi:hypothetical protein